MVSGIGDALAQTLVPLSTGYDPRRTAAFALVGAAYFPLSGNPTHCGLCYVLSRGRRQQSDAANSIENGRRLAEHRYFGPLLHGWYVMLSRLERRLLDAGLSRPAAVIAQLLINQSLGAARARRGLSIPSGRGGAAGAQSLTAAAPRALA